MMCKPRIGAIKRVLISACCVMAVAVVAQAQSFQVTEVFLKAEEANASGPCPLRVVFNGYIKANGPGIVEYTFTRSDGATGPAHTLVFSEAGTQAVTADWTLGDATALPSYEGWQSVRILAANKMESSRETGRFSITCGKGDKEATFGPSTPVIILGPDSSGGKSANTGSDAALTGRRVTGIERNLELEREAAARHREIAKWLQPEAKRKLEAASLEVIKSLAKSSDAVDPFELAQAEVRLRFAVLSEQQLDLLTFYVLADVAQAIAAREESSKVEIDRTIELGEKEKSDSLSDLSEEQSLRVQMFIDRSSKFMRTLANLMKKVSDTASTITQNLK